MFWTLCMILFIMEWGLVHILELGFERNYGETFHRNCYYRGRMISKGGGDRVSFLPILSLRLSNELLSLDLVIVFFTKEYLILCIDLQQFLLRGSFSQFCGVTAEEWCSRYFWVISFGALQWCHPPLVHGTMPHSTNWLLWQVRRTTQDSQATIKNKHFQKSIHAHLIKAEHIASKSLPSQYL